MPELRTAYGEGTIRNQDVAPQLADVLTRAAEAAGVDVVEIFSGGQDPFGTGYQRTGSPRHDGGNAADVRLIVGGRTLDFNNEADRAVFESFITTAVSLGAQGVGAGDGYMGPNAIHIGYGNPVAWGDGGRSANAPAWLTAAWQAGLDNPQHPVPPNPVGAPTVTAAERLSSGGYTIRRGDTLTAIADRFGTTVEAIARANGIADPNRISEGQNLTIPGQAQGTATSYSVRQGDTMAAIARRHGLTLEELGRLNPDIEDLDRIFVDQEIRVGEETDPGRGVIFPRLAEMRERLGEGFERFADARSNGATVVDAFDHARGVGDWVPNPRPDPTGTVPTPSPRPERPPPPRPGLPEGFGMGWPGAQEEDPRGFEPTSLLDIPIGGVDPSTRPRETELVDPRSTVRESEIPRGFAWPQEESRGFVPPSLADVLTTLQTDPNSVVRESELPGAGYDLDATAAMLYPGGDPANDIAPTPVDRVALFQEAMDRVGRPPLPGQDFALGLRPPGPGGPTSGPGVIMRGFPFATNPPHVSSQLTGPPQAAPAYTELDITAGMMDPQGDPAADVLPSMIKYTGEPETLDPFGLGNFETDQDRARIKDTLTTSAEVAARSGRALDPTTGGYRSPIQPTTKTPARAPGGGTTPAKIKPGSVPASPAPVKKARPAPVAYGNTAEKALLLELGLL